MLPTAIFVSIASLLPSVVGAVTYTADGAVMLGNKPAQESSNLAAAVGVSQFDFTTLLLITLMISSLYLFHIIWHPKRQHDTLDEKTRKNGSITFYLGGLIVWMLISVMAESWSVLLPLALIFAGTLVYYLIQKSELVQASKSRATL